MAGTAVRVLTVLELLQAHDKITGAEIAERLDVDARSVRRYIKQLHAMGIPVESERGRYGAYQLERGYRLPPLMFREEEIIALTIGLLVIRAFQFPLDSAGIAGALAKIQRTVPRQFFDQVQVMQNIVHFHPVLPTSKVDKTIVDAVARGVWKTTSLQIGYQSRFGDATERLFDPYGIVFYQSDWYTVGYCHLRRDIRIFRLDRISAVQTTDCSFTPRPDFDALDYVVHALSNPADVTQVEVLFNTTLEEAMQSIPPRLGEFEVVEGGVVFRCPALRLDWIAALLLSLDFPIRIVQPEELKDKLRGLAHKALSSTLSTQ
ncbi:YafY family transcriptional regulator [Candidatus Gracilibacteria bacterium]|nr:YafY family transcriptional regulator [Candidatus Gracilibacteria bacterium]